MKMWPLFTFVHHIGRETVRGKVGGVCRDHSFLKGPLQLPYPTPKVFLGTIDGRRDFYRTCCID